MPTDPVVIEINKVLWAVKELSSHVKTAIDIQDKRQEEHYYSIYELRENMRALEEYLGIELAKPKGEIKKYKKRT